MDGGDADLVVCILDDDRDKSVPLGDHVRHLLDHIHIFAAQGQRVDASVGEHNELYQVDRVGTLTEYTPLRSALTAVLEKTFHILEVAYICTRSERLCGVQQFTVTSKDVTNLSLRDGHEGSGMNNILNRHQVM